MATQKTEDLHTLFMLKTIVIVDKVRWPIRILTSTLNIVLKKESYFSVYTLMFVRHS